MTTLSTGGMIFMIASWIAIIGLNAFCFYRVMKGSESSDAK